MNSWTQLFTNGDVMPGASDIHSILLNMSMSFVLGICIGYIYMWTHDAISYSRTFVASLVVMPLIVSAMMVLMSGGILVAFGLLAVFGVVRFRNVLKDTRDTMYILWAITTGLAIGTMHYSTAMVTSMGIAGVFLFLRVTSFGIRNRYDAVLTLRLAGDLVSRKKALKNLLSRHSARWTMASEQRATKEGMDVTYRLLLRDPSRSDELRTELAGLEGLENVSLYMHSDEAEI